MNKRDGKKAVKKPFNEDDFFADILVWRETFARNVAIRNKDLSLALNIMVNCSRSIFQKR
jgi:hypothetical protein